MKAKYRILLLFLLVNFINLNAQKSDSLHSAFKNAKEDTTKLLIKFEIGENEVIERTPYWDSLAKELAGIIIKLPLKLKSKYILKMCVAYNYIGYIYQEKGDTKNGFKYFNKSLVLATQTNKVLKSNDFVEIIALMQNNIAFVFKNTGDILNAIDYSYKSLKNYESIQNDEGISLLYNNLASIFQAQKDQAKALEFYRKSLNISKKNNDSESQFSALMNIGQVYYEINKQDSALMEWEKCIHILKTDTTIEETNEFVLYSNIGALYRDLNKNKIAQEYYEKSFALYKKTEDIGNISLFLGAMGENLLLLNELARAEMIINLCMKYAIKSGYPHCIADAYNAMSKLYQNKGKYREALEYRSKAFMLKDSLMGVENQRAAIRSQYKYAYEKEALKDSIAHFKETEVKDLALQKQEVELESKRKTQYVLFSGLAIVILFSGALFNRYRVTQKQKLIIEQKEKITQEQNLVISHQKHLVEEKHKEITDSINYAERIQRSFLATKELLNEHLAEYFVFFRPKDVVSGDFYWAAQLNNGQFAVVAADSTGHGVPGAIMSILNISSLEKSIENYCRTSDILNETRKIIIERLKKDGSPEGGKDGMDCSLTCYDFVNLKLYYSAAFNPVWIVRDKQLIELKPDKMPVGKHDNDNVPFTEHEFELKKGDLVYTLTDGYADQFGGPKGKKFKYKPLQELLLSIATEPMEFQKQKLNEVFNTWKGNLEQVDDVCIIGVKI